MVFAVTFAVNVPYWDSWDYTEVITGVRPVTLGYLWEQHNEHRLVWEKLFILASARLTGWNEYWMALVPGVLIGAAGMIFVSHVLAERRTWPATARLFLAIIGAGWPLTLRQWENLYWSAGFTLGLILLVFVMFGSTFRTYSAGEGGVWRLLVLITVATFSYAGGLAVGSFVLLHGLLGSWLGKPLSKTYLYLCAWSLMVIAAYLWRYQTGSDTLSSLNQPLVALNYSLVYLGSPFAANVILAWWMGLVFAVLLLIAFSVTATADGLAAALWEVSARYPTMVLGAMVMGIIVVGRSVYGVEQAAASRYVTVSALFIASGWVYLCDRVARWRPSMRITSTALVCLVTVIAWLGASLFGNAVAAAHRARLVAYRNCVVAHPTTFSHCQGIGVYPNHRLLMLRTAMLLDSQLSFFHK